MIFESVRYVFLSISLLLSLQVTLYSGSGTRSSAKLNDTLIFQVVFTEIMADPVPSTGLPGYEYLEICNRGSIPLHLGGWKLVIGKYERILNDEVINPDEYIILCDSNVDSLYSIYGHTLPVDGFPAILNTGQTITLKTMSETIVHSVTFSDRWYRTSTGKEGGHSLEIIDVNNPCGGAANWCESVNPKGGTPGSENTVSDNNPDLRAPALLRVTLPADSSVMIHFSESMDCRTLQARENYSINNGIFHPDHVYALEPDFTKALLIYPVKFRPDLRYTITVLNTLEDCAGNNLGGTTFYEFSLPQSPEASDIVINEIMFHPAEGFGEFVELYNRSDKTLDMACMKLSLADFTSGEIQNSIDFGEYPFILSPKTFAVVTKYEDMLPGEVRFQRPGVILTHPGLFSLPDKEGLIILADSDLQTIDECNYSNKMHDSMLRETEGVSLERVDPQSPSSDTENWHSAAATAGYSTPGLRNSQMTSGKNNQTVTLLPEVFSPDGDGVDDILTIQLHLDEPGWYGTLRLFDMRGALVNTIITNSLLGTDQLFTWDGATADDKPAEIGLYLLFGELYNPLGEIKKFKKVITLIRKYKH